MLTGYQRKTVMMNMHAHKIVQRHVLNMKLYYGHITTRRFDVWDMEPFIFQDETRIGLTSMREMPPEELERMAVIMTANHVLSVN